MISAIRRCFGFVACASSLLNIFSVSVSAGEMIGYSHVSIFRENRAVCKGLLLKNTVISAAHCFLDADGLSIRSRYGDKISSISPRDITLDPGVARNGTPRDAAAIHVDLKAVPNTDGFIDVSPSATLMNSSSNSNKSAFIEEPRDSDHAVGGAASSKSHRLILKHVMTFDQLMEYSEADPETVSAPDIGPDRIAKFSLSMSRKMFLTPNDILCQGRSGSPVFAETNEIKRLIGIAVKGKPNAYTDGLLCGNSIYILRMDAGGLDWIASQIK